MPFALKRRITITFPVNPWAQMLGNRSSSLAIEEFAILGAVAIGKFKPVRPRFCIILSESHAKISFTSSPSASELAGQTGNDTRFRA